MRGTLFFLFSKKKYIGGKKMNYNEKKGQLLGGKHHSIRIPEDLNNWIEEEAKKIGVGYGTFVKIILNKAKNRGE